MWPVDRHSGPKTTAGRRRGAVLLIILVCFTLAAAMLVVLARLAVTARNAAETQHWAVQAQWLAEAGLERAAARLAAEPGYRGETWTIPASELGGKGGAVVKIVIESDPFQPARRNVTVEADYPDDPVHRSRYTKEIMLEERHEKPK